MKKKLFVIFLTLVMVVTMMPLSVYADSQEREYNSFKETMQNNEETNEYLNFKAIDDDVRINLEKNGTPDTINLQYSFDKVTWKNFKLGDAKGAGVLIGSEKTVYIKTNSEGKIYPGKGWKNYWNFSMASDSGEVEAGGNIMSLVYKDYGNALKITNDFGFCGLFKGCDILTKSPTLPATTLSKGCYRCMFEHCESLKEAPKLPANKLYEECYAFMFSNCDALIKTPDLHAKNLANACYFGMFESCMNLKEVSELPSTTLCDECYSDMFWACPSLKKAPKLPAIKLKKGCYSSMFEKCENLVEAPVLPALSLAESCYHFMFCDCKKLKKIDASFLQWVNEDNHFTNATEEWLAGTNSAGNFVCYKELEINKRDSNHVPSNWTITRKETTLPRVSNFSAKSIDSKTCSLSWNKINITGVKYLIYRSTKQSSGYMNIATVSKHTYTDSKVKPGTKYFYKVRAVAGTEIGNLSKMDSAYPRLFQVTGISAKALNAAKAQITWKANGNKNVYYQVYISTKPNKGFKRVATIKNGKTTYTQKFTPTQSGKKYYFKVRAITKDYTGKWHYGKFSKVDYAYPRVNTPTNFKAWASSKHTCHCSWSKVPGSNIKYLVYRGTKPTGNWGNAKAITKKTSFTNKHMRSGRKYYYMVRAVQTINDKKYYSNYSAKDYAYPR